MPQYAIMRFQKQKGGVGALEAHHERTKAKYASNPDIDTGRSKHNIHIVKPETSYNLQRFVDSLPEEVKRQARATQKSQGYQK